MYFYILNAQLFVYHLVRFRFTFAVTLAYRMYIILLVWHCALLVRVFSLVLCVAETVNV